MQLKIILRRYRCLKAKYYEIGNQFVTLFDF